MKQGWSSFMERRVKERLVGATILGLLVVLIVPEMLSGPKRAVMVPQAAPAGPPFRSLTVDLTTNKATAEGDATSAANPETAPGAGSAGLGEAATAAANPATAAADAATPAPDAVAPAAPAAGPAPEESGPATVVADAPTPAPDAATPAAKDGPVHSGWAAQLGSFAARGNAEKLERQLRIQGFSPLLSAAGAGRGLRYRIRVGPFADRAAADRAIARLKAAGHPASIVSP